MLTLALSLALALNLALTLALALTVALALTQARMSQLAKARPRTEEEKAKARH